MGKKVYGKKRTPNREFGATARTSHSAAAGGRHRRGVSPARSLAPPASSMNNFLARHLETLGGPKPKGWTGDVKASKRSPAAPALPQGGGLPVFEKRVQLKESLPTQARGSPSKDGTPPRPPVPIEPDIPRRQTLKSATPLPKMRTPRETGGPDSPTSGSYMATALGWKIEPAPPMWDKNGMGYGSPSLAPMGGGASTRSNNGLAVSQRTSSPSGRMHPNPVRRAELRKADMFNNIDYYGYVLPHPSTSARACEREEAAWPFSRP